MLRTRGRGWRLRDAITGACRRGIRTGSRIRRAKSAGGKPVCWGKRLSLNVAYAGPGLAASRRYYWRVQAWDQDGKPYPPSEISWWETGLLGQETVSECCVRGAGVGGFATLLLARAGVGSGREAVSAERNQLVGNRFAGAR